MREALLGFQGCANSGRAAHAQGAGWGSCAGVQVMKGWEERNTKEPRAPC